MQLAFWYIESIASIIYCLTKSITIMKSILLFIFSTACFLSTYAQELHYIKGNVTDENHKPLPYVAVTLSDPDSILIKGAVTDSTGHFTFNNIERGKYIFSQQKAWDSKTFQTLS